MDYIQFHELYHSGVKGMKWGVRKFQNEDGSLTPEGRERYGVDSDGRMSKEGRKQFKQDSRIQNRVDHKTSNAIGKGVTTGLITVAASTVTTLGGIALQYAGLKSDNAGVAIAGNVLSAVGKIGYAASGVAGIASGIKRLKENENLGVYNRK